MAYNSTAFSEFVDNTERSVMAQVKEAKPDMVRGLYMPVPWSPGDPDRVTFNSVALSGFAGRVDENENYPMIDPTLGDELDKTQIQYGDKLTITRRMAKFNNRYAVAKFDAPALANRLKNVLDLELTQQCFGEADQTTMTPPGKAAVSIATADTLAFASASHTVNGAAGSTFSNVLSGAGALSMDNMTSAMATGEQNTVDDQGTYLSPNFNTLVIAQDANMERKAREMLGSSLIPENSNNAVNVYNGAMKLVVLKHGQKNMVGTVASANRYRWVIMDSEMARGALQLQMAESPTTEQKFINEDNILASILVTQFAAFAAVRWQGFVFSLSTTAPTS